MLQPSDGDTVQGIVHVIGRVQVPNFSHYVVEYGETHSPQAWGQVGIPGAEQVEAGLLVEWDTGRLNKDGPHVMRVVAVDNTGRRYESASVRLQVLIPTPTPQPTSTPTTTPTPSPSASATPSPSATATATVTDTPLPSDTPMPAATPTS